MDYEVNFGGLTMAAAKTSGKKTTRFRIGLLGDFSGGANAGRLQTGADLSARKPLRVDAENLDATMARLKIKLALPLGPQGSAVEVILGSLDDFHPDQLNSNLGLFTELSGLRQRLKSSSTFAKAAQELQSWAGTIPVAAPPPRSAARGSVLPIDAKLSDFSALVGRPSAKATAPSLKALLQQVVAPHIVPAKSPDQDAMVAAVDEALSGAMRSVLHHPEFQTLEALWRSVDFLVRRLETDETLELVLFDISAEELAADLSKDDSLETSGLYQLLVEQPASDVHEGPFSAFIGLYTFERTPPHAELLGRLAKIVACAPAAFISSVGSDCLDQNPRDLHPLIKSAWAALKELPEAGYLSLACPRFLLRLPYGDRTESIEAFEFEEFTAKTGLRGMLWGNPAVIGALLLGQTFIASGSKLKLGSTLGVDEMPFHYYVDQDGDQIALPCTERFMTSKLSTLLSNQGIVPLVCMKGAPEVRLGGFASVTGRQLAGPWAPIPITTRELEPEEEEEPAPPPPKAKPAARKEEPAPEPVAVPEPEAPTPEPEPVAEVAPPAAPAPAPEEPAPVAEAAPEPAAASAATSELDSLLADLNTQEEKKEEESAEAQIDPELAALLADLA
jgi:type VI secretion system protein ImpC